MKAVYNSIAGAGSGHWVEIGRYEALKRQLLTVAEYEAEWARELLALLGPCEWRGCRLHLGHKLAHSVEPRQRNVHCSNCGDTRGGPVGHETSECTFDSKAASRN